MRCLIMFNKKIESMPIAFLDRSNMYALYFIFLSD